MGDMADLALDYACDDCEEWDEYISGNFSQAEAYDRGLIDELGYEGRGTKGWMTLVGSIPSKKPLQCRNCGSKDVEWGQYPSGKWFLFTNGEPHRCNQSEADYAT
jgi:hypothetical protein